jgi:hypothetical protein
MASETASVISSLTEDEERIAEVIANDRMYYVLAQFLETDDNKNIATVLGEIATELKLLRQALEAAKRADSSS